MSKHNLRTTGRLTGNFGKPKVKGKPGELEISKIALSKENMRIPTRDEGFARLKEAYEITTDPKLKAALADMLKKRAATLNIKFKP